MDPFRKVQPGQRLQIPAAAYNAFIDTAKAYQASQQGVSATTGRANMPAGVVYVRNDTAGLIPRFGVLGIDGILIDPADNEREFLNGPAFKGVAPTAAHASGKVLIAQEPIAASKIGRAMLIGVTPVMIDVVAEADTHATIIASDSAKLRSGGSGPATILWKATGTGVKQAVIRLDEVRPQYFPVKVYKTSGSAGSKTIPCTFVYAVKALDGTTVLGTNIALSQPRRQYGQYVAQADGGYGVAFYDGTTLKLWDAGEVPAVRTDCPT